MTSWSYVAAVVCRPRCVPARRQLPLVHASWVRVWLTPLRDARARLVATQTGGTTAEKRAYKYAKNRVRRLPCRRAHHALLSATSCARCHDVCVCGLRARCLVCACAYLLHRWLPRWATAARLLCPPPPTTRATDLLPRGPDPCSWAHTSAPTRRRRWSRTAGCAVPRAREHLRHRSPPPQCGAAVCLPHRRPNQAGVGGCPACLRPSKLWPALLPRVDYSWRHCGHSGGARGDLACAGASLHVPVSRACLRSLGSSLSLDLGGAQLRRVPVC